MVSKKTTKSGWRHGKHYKRLQRECLARGVHPVDIDAIGAAFLGPLKAADPPA